MKEKQSNMQDAIYKNLQENKNYAYEIRVEDKSGHILIVPRTNNIEAFNENMESVRDIARQEGKNIKVNIYRGMSPKAGKVEEYPISLGDNSRNNTSSLYQIERAVDIAMKKYQTGNNIGGFDGISQLLGVLTGSDADTENSGNSLTGITGLLGVVNNARHENTLMQFEKKLNDYKLETQLSTLQKDLSTITAERDLLKSENSKLEKENSSYKTEVSDLETRLAGYSNTELLKRVATGVLSGIGSKILGNSPKAAELMGLTKDELQAALGFVDEDEALMGHDTIPQTDVEIEEVPTPKTEEQKRVFQAINNTSKALMQGDMKFAYYMVNIIGNCMDSNELTKSMINHLNQEVMRLGLNAEEESQEQMEDE